MKTAIKYLLHKLFGFRTYLYLFARYKILTLRGDQNERDFFYFLEMLPKEGTVLDIGANIGIMTVHLARESSRKVIAFEPMPVNREALLRVVDLYALQSQVVLLDCALGNEEGTVEMVMPVSHGVRMQGLSHVVHESIPDNNDGVRIKVPVHTLDSIPEIKGEKIVGIKMDVENFEYFVLLGAKQLLLNQHPVIYIELWDNENRVNCFNLMTELGYRILVPRQGKLIPYKTGEYQGQNFILLPETLAAGIINVN